MYPMPFYLNKIDGAGYIEKYGFSLGSGAYTMIENSKKVQKVFIFKRRDNYWAKDQLEIRQNNSDKIKFIFIEDDNQQVVSFMNGDYDIYPFELNGGLKDLFLKFKEIEKGGSKK